MAEGDWNNLKGTDGPSTTLNSGMSSMGLNGSNGNGRGRGKWFIPDKDNKPGDSGSQNGQSNYNQESAYQSGSNGRYQGGHGGGGYRGNTEARGGGGGGGGNYNKNTESSDWGGGDGGGGNSNGGWESSVGNGNQDNRGYGQSDSDVGRGRGRGRGRGGFNSDRGGFNSDRGGFNSDRGGFNSDRGGFTSDRGVFNSDLGGFNSGRDGSRNYGNSGCDEDDVPSGGRGGGHWGGRGGSGYGRGGYENGGGRGYRGGRGGSRRDNSEDGGGGGGYNNENCDGYHGGRGGGGYRQDGESSGGYRGGRGRGGRDDNEGGGGGGYRGARGGRGGYRREDENGGAYNGGYGDSSRDEHGEAEEKNEAEEARPPPYVPPEKADDDDDQNYIPSGINFSKYADIPVNVSGCDVPPSITSFEESGLRNILLENVKKANYTVPTPIQKTSIPVIMAGRDLMSCAQTGSGKTAAFLLPMLHKMIAMGVPVQPGDVQSILGLIVAPTRELADQIETEALKFARRSMIRVAVAYGGTSVFHQFRKIENGIHLLVATPGRLLDIINRGKLNFENLQFLVLDEADRMLQMGFKENIDTLLSHETMPKMGLRQTLMFSATFPREIQLMAAAMLNNYVFVVIGCVGGANEDIDQHVYQVNKFDKRNKLPDVVNIQEKTMIFVATKKQTDFIASVLSHKDIPSTSIHGDRHQYQREEALHDFRTGKMKTIICTDVAARGLDIKGVDHVINFDMPSNIEDYVHRIGRTGRVGNPGKATTFFDSERDVNLANDLVRILSEAHQEVPEFLQLSAGGMQYEARGGGNRFGSRDIRNPQEFQSRSNTDHYESRADDPAEGIAQEESWD